MRALFGEFEQLPDWVVPELVEEGAAVWRRWAYALGALGNAGTNDTYTEGWLAVPLSLSGGYAGQRALHRYLETSRWWIEVCRPGALLTPGSLGRNGERYVTVASCLRSGDCTAGGAVVRLCVLARGPNRSYRNAVTTSSHPAEPHAGSVASKLNWLRAGVLGANDGIVSTAGIVVGVAAATAERAPILTAGVAGLAAGAVSMALGEYVSVSTQRDTEKALLTKERQELRDDPATELDELGALYEGKGLSPATARMVAAELTQHDAFAAHAEIELGIKPDDLTSPWQAALSSALSFTVGALLPIVAILAPPAAWRVPVTAIAVLVALVFTGLLSATLGGAPKQRAVLRNVIGGGLALVITYAIGHLVGAAIA